MDWSYQGLRRTFFRAEGGDSSPFGVQQTASSPKLTKVFGHLNKYDIVNDQEIDLQPGVEIKKYSLGFFRIEVHIL